jgi:DNA-binding transcriptional ArsR family regulator
MADPVELSGLTREFLRALVSENRQRILLLFADGRRRTVGEVAADVGIGQSTASEQLAILRRANIVRAQRDGKTVWYSPYGTGIAAALTELQEMLKVCCPPD